MPAYEATTLETAAVLYLRHLDASRNSPQYIKNSKTTLRQLASVVGGSRRVHNITPQDVTDLKTSLSHCSDSTINTKQVQLRGFCNWARGMKIAPRTWDPMAIHKQRKTVLTIEHVRVPRSDWPALLDAAAHPTHRAMIALGLYGMLRSSEALTLRVQDYEPFYDKSRFGLHIVRHKTKTRDVLPISLELCAEIDRYLAWYSDDQGQRPKKGWFLFPTSQWKRGTTSRDDRGRILTGQRIFDPARHMAQTASFARPTLEAAGWTGEWLGFHTFRRSGARALYDELRTQGRDSALRITQMMLGHKSLEQTETYVGAAADREQRDELLSGRFMFADSDTANDTVTNLTNYRRSLGE